MIYSSTRMNKMEDNAVKLKQGLLVRKTTGQRGTLSSGKDLSLNMMIPPKSTDKVFCVTFVKGEESGYGGI